jgi:hypothetical protein
MTDYHQFGEPSGAGFIDTHFDFSRCQRPDGSYYGTGGQCRKGAPVDPKEKQLRPAKERTAQTSTVTEQKAAKQKADAEAKAFKSRGGYIPRAGTGEAQEYDVRHFEDVLGVDRKTAREVEQSVKKMERAGAEYGGDGVGKPGVSIDTDGIAITTQSKAGDVSEMFIAKNGIVSWSVNGGYDRSISQSRTMSSAEKREIAVNARKSWDVALAGMPKGTILQTNAYTGDGGGNSRARAYQAMGFSKPYRNKPGNTQFGKVRKNGFGPITNNEGEIDSLLGYVGPAYTLGFSESDRDKKVEAALYIILFGTQK